MTKGTTALMCPDPAPPGAADALHWRAAADSDIAAVAALVQLAYRGEASAARWTTEAELIKGQRTNDAQLRALISAPMTRLMLAFYPVDALIGCFQLEKRTGGLAYFGMFAIPPSAQGAGLGRRMLAAAEEFARTLWGCTAMEMTVIGQRTELIDWYGRRGYQRTGEHRPFPYGQDEFGVPQRGDLYFEVLRKTL